MANKINIVISAEDKASKPIRGVAGEMDDASGKADKFSGSLKGLASMAGGAALAVGAAGLAGAVIGLKQGFEFNSQVEQAQTKLMAFMKDNERVAKTLDWVKQEAAATQFSFTDMADAAANLTPVSKTSGVALEGLVRQAEILAAINPTEGLTGATFSLREALSGDWVSIVDRFNLPRKRINQLKEEGVPAMEIISRTLQEMGIDYTLVAQQGKTVSARWDQITDKLKMMAGQATKPIFERVSKELEWLGTLDYNRIGERMADIFTSGIRAVDGFVGTIRDTYNALRPFGPMLIGLGAGILTYNLIMGGATLATNALAAAQAALAAAMRLNPFALAAGAAMGIVTAYLQVVSQSDNASSASDRLKDAHNRLRDATNQAKDAQDRLKGALFDQEGAALRAESAQRNYERAVRDFGPGSLEARQALYDLKRANDDLARANDDVRNKTNEATRAEQEKKKAAADFIATNDAIKDSAYRAAGGYAALAHNIREARAEDAKTGKLGIGKNEVKAVFGMKNALGTSYSFGGDTLVGEHGPEIIRMPRGAQVTPAYQTRSGEGASTPSQVLNVTNNIYNQTDYKKMLSDVGFALRLAS